MQNPAMIDTIHSFYKPGERPFVEALLLLGRAEEAGLSFRVEPGAGEHEEATLWAAGSGDRLEDFDAQIRRWKKPAVWWLRAEWPGAAAAGRLFRSARRWLSEELAEEDDPGADLLLEERVETTRWLRTEEEERMEAIQHAMNRVQTPEALRRALAGYIRFWLRAAEEQAQLEKSDPDAQLQLTAPEVPA
jgi:hypothetical protein